jgi:hypothetical protein
MRATRQWTGKELGKVVQTHKWHRLPNKSLTRTRRSRASVQVYGFNAQRRLVCR